MSPQADINFERELWETAVTLRGTVAPAGGVAVGMLLTDVIRRVQSS